MKKEEVLKIAKEHYWFLSEFSEWNNDKEVVLTAVQQNGAALYYASDELKNDKEVVFAAVQNYGKALQYSSKELKNDKEIVMAAIQQNGYYLQHASNELKNNKEVVSAAVEQNGLFLQYASNELRNDKEVVVIAVQKDGFALYYASDELRNDKEVVVIAVRQNSATCQVSLLKDYQNFDEIVEKESEEFLFSCWNNKEAKTRLRVANHPNFLPTIEQIEICLKDKDEEIKQIYQLRQDEWSAKIEENKLRNII